MGKSLLKARSKTKKVRASRAAEYLAELKYRGDEPEANKEYGRVEFAQALTWYANMADTKELRQWMEEFIGKGSSYLRKFRSIPDKMIPRTACAVARMLRRGCTLPARDDGDISMGYVFKSIDAAIEACQNLDKDMRSTEEEETPKKEKVRPDIQARIDEKVWAMIADLEDVLDAENHEFSLYDHLTSVSFPPNLAIRVGRYYEEIAQELEDAAAGKFKEGYKQPKAWIKARAKFVRSLVDDARRYADNTKKVRKTVRKKRPPTAEKLLKHFQYQKEDRVMKIASVDPAKIIGAQEVWAYNTKYNLLTVFRAVDRGGLSVKGTTFTGFDESASLTKRLGKKGAPMVQRVLEGGKIVLKKAMDEIKGDPIKIAARSNANTVILRVVS